ncbi:MAG: hypothetical protein AAF458_13945 [Pseudomonadota bacterium]
MVIKRYRAFWFVLTLALTVAALPVGARVIVEAKASPLSAYVGQQIVLQVRVLRPVGTAEGQLSEPEVAGADVSLLGSIDIYTERRGDTDFQVLHKRYAVVPRRSGNLEIRGMEFARAAADATQYTDDPGLPDEAAMSVPAAAETLVINVTAPGRDGERGLPVAELILSDRWSRPPESVPRGEALTRTVTTSARGIAAADLPAVEMPKNRAYILHTDQPELTTEFSADGMHARRTDRFVLLVTESVEVPPIEVPWFDPVDRTQHVARIDRVKLLVSAGSQLRFVSRTPEALRANNRPWLGLGVVICLALGIAYGFRHWRSRAWRRAVHAFRRACVSADAKLAARSLLEIGRLRWPEHPPGNLLAVAERLGGEAAAAAALRELDRCLYRNEDHWDAANCLRTVQRALRRRTGRVASTATPLLKLH